MVKVSRLWPGTRMIKQQWKEYIARKKNMFFSDPCVCEWWSGASPGRPPTPLFRGCWSPGMVTE